MNTENQPTAPDSEVNRNNEDNSSTEVQNDESFNLFFPENDHVVFIDDKGVEYLTHTKSGVARTFEIVSSTFSNYLRLLYFDVNKSLPKNKDLKDAIAIYKIRALHGGIKKTVSTRVGKTDDGLEIDLCNNSFKVIRVNEDGIQSNVEPSIPFIRFNDMLELPPPVDNQGFDELWSTLRITNEDDQKLFIVCLLSAIRPNPPYFILVLLGEAGSSKSSTAKALKFLIDPSGVPLRALSKNEHQLVILLSKCRVACFDNVSTISNEISDSLCTAAVGGGLSVRQLYKDSEDIIFKPQNPMVLNGITNIIERPDLISRSIIIELPSIQPEERVTEEEFLRRLEDMRPRILGALLDAASFALKHKATCSRAPVSRMADAELWVSAAEENLGWEQGTTQRILKANQVKALTCGIEAFPIAEILHDLVGKEENDKFEGTATELLRKLDLGYPHLKRLKEWPKAPNILSKQLGRLTNALRLTARLNIDLSQRHGNTRKITITKLPLPT